MNKCIIIGAGECDTADLKKHLIIADGDYCIAADGGLDYLIQIGIEPNLVMGDLDSVTDTDKTQNYETRIFPPEKDDTDMLLAIKEGLARGYRYFEIYGALGGRFDHTFANIQCLNFLINNNAEGRLIGSNGSFITMIKNSKITFKASQYEPSRKISVFAYGGTACGVTECGLKYTTDNITIKSDFPIGISNEFTGEDAYIKVSDGILMIYVD
jgi:thiamine pyrophosphokinase